MRVLIVEDDAALRADVARAVAAAPDMRLVGAAGDLATGRQLLAERPDVLLVDLGLPDGNGIGLIREAAGRLPGVQIMVLTVFGDESSVMQSIAAGATGYLLKDLPAAQVVLHVRELHAGGSPLSPVIARQILNRVPHEALQAPPDDDAVSLSDQESCVLSLAATGLSYEEIAGVMGISRHSVQTYVKRAYRKLQVHSKVQALSAARRLRLLRG
ncbi:MAG TPA: response regulator transcription factor [Steroidobacteraceae bacterium]|nr:response regulator transcription factor [Steroidobacteraceae bacterium]